VRYQSRKARGITVLVIEGGSIMELYVRGRARWEEDDGGCFSEGENSRARIPLRLGLVVFGIVGRLRLKLFG
jgi:hypothetical protein